MCPDAPSRRSRRYHFDYCYPAMLTVFILLTGEWIDAMEPACAILGTGYALFFIFVVLLGKYLLMNLLVAVILTEFAEDEDAERHHAPRRGAMRRQTDPQAPRASS